MKENLFFEKGSAYSSLKNMGFFINGQKGEGMLIFKLPVVAIALVLVFPPVPGLLAQQANTDKAKQDAAPRAPVPTQIFTAKRVFISNSTGEDNDIGYDHYNGGPDRAYNQFYGAMKSWGRYDLVSIPSEADLFLELHFSAPPGPVNASRGSTHRPQFRLAILDPKTHAVLWTFTEYLGKERGTHDESFDQAMNKIADDVKRLSARVQAKAEGDK